MKIYACEYSFFLFLSPLSLSCHHSQQMTKESKSEGERERNKIDEFVYYLGADIAHACWTSLWSSSSLNDCLCCLPTTTIILFFIFYNMPKRKKKIQKTKFEQLINCYYFAVKMQSGEKWNLIKFTFIFATSVLFQWYCNIGVNNRCVLTSIAWIVNNSWWWYNRSRQWTWYCISRS